MPVSAQEFRKRMDRFNDHCRTHHLIATPQRLAVFGELATSCKHPSAESIHRQVRTRLPSLSLDTVYRTLRFFEQQGLIERVGSDGQRARFDADISRHAHFVCKVCGWVGDIPDSEQYPDPPHPTEPYGTIQSVHLEFRGICRKCSQSRSEVG